MGQSLQKIQNSEEGLMHQLVILPFRETLTGWRDGLTRSSHGSTKEKANPFLCGGILPCASTPWGPTSWKAVLMDLRALVEN